jgi:hypothetical protein
MNLGFFTSGAFIGDYNGITASNRPPSPVTGAAAWWPVAAAGRCNRRGPGHKRQGIGAAPAASGSKPWFRRPAGRFDVGGRLADGVQVDTEQLGAALQGTRDRTGQGGVVGVPGGHAR